MTSDVFSNTSQLVMRNHDLLRSDRLLMLAPPADGLATALLSEGGASEMLGLTKDYAVFRRLESAWQRGGSRQQLVYGAVLPVDSPGAFDGVLLFLQKSKPLMGFWLDMITTVLAPEGKVWLVGENGEGIKSWRKRLKSHFSEICSIDSARHCGLIEASGLVKSAKPFSSADYFQQFEVKSGENSIKGMSLPGVFCHGRLDRGTAILLETLKDVTAKKVLDFGCGAGVISAAIAARLPEAELTLVDCDALALESSRKTLGMNNARKYQVLASDGLSNVTGCFDLIVSNPPFHQGVKTHYEVTEQFLSQSSRYLVKGGELRVVANSFLRYEPIIKKAFGNCSVLSVKDGFTIYSARKS